MTPRAHKPADSGVPVGNGARSCGFQEVSLNALKRAHRSPSQRAKKVTLPVNFDSYALS